MVGNSIPYAISVVTRDRVAVIADITEVLYELGGNLEALSQTVVWGWFTMIVCGKFPPDVSAAQIKEAIEGAEDCAATVLPSDEPVTLACVEGEPYVVTAVGIDKPGIVRRLTHCFAVHGINIDDVWNEVRDDQFIIIFRLTVPKDVDRREVRDELYQMAQELDVSVTLQHQHIFTATNSLAVHTRQLSPRSRS